MAEMSPPLSVDRSPTELLEQLEKLIEPFYGTCANYNPHEPDSGYCHGCGCSDWGHAEAKTLRAIRKTLTESQQQIAALTAQHKKDIDEALADAKYHADCRPNRQQAEAAMADAKAVNDRNADLIRENRELQARLATLTAEKAALAERYERGELYEMPNPRQPLTAPLPAGEPRRTDLSEKDREQLVYTLEIVKVRLEEDGCDCGDANDPLCPLCEVDKSLVIARAYLAAPVIDREEGQ